MALFLFLDTVWESFTLLPAAQQGVLPTEHWETIPGTGTPSAADEAVLGSLTHKAQLLPAKNSGCWWSVF